MIDLSPLSRHSKVAFSFSGGKDSMACIYLLRDRLADVTVYHMDTGDLLPEIREVVDWVEAMCPNFVRIKGDVLGWIRDHGYPTDLLPYSTHGVGVAAGQNRTKLVTRYHCCFVNLMFPVWDRIKADGNTLCIRGTKLADMAKLPAHDGETHEGVEMWFPVNTWSHADVMDYLRQENAPIARLYDHMVNAPECARCPAWWNEGRGAYLKEFYPDHARDYAEGLRIVAAELAAPIANLARELKEMAA